MIVVGEFAQIVGRRTWIVSYPQRDRRVDVITLCRQEAIGWRFAASSA